MREVAFVFADGFEAFGESGEDGGGGAKKGDEAAAGYGSCAHGTDVGATRAREGVMSWMGTVPG